MSGFVFGNFKIRQGHERRCVQKSAMIGGVSLHLVLMHRGEDAVDFSNADLNDSLVVSCQVIGRKKFLP